MPTLAFLLVILSATVHALWNFATKKVSGDLGVIWIGLVIGCIFFSPCLFFLNPDQIVFREVYPHIILFVFQMAPVSYVVAAREFAVAIGTFLGFMFLKEQITLMKVIGISIIVMGMMLIKIA
ncbi:MAG: hypothetical protein DHS20C18_32190 [Saprospiraceae bacterium]|nr:MAG: hypothetical protein DHS20C18_32190 [Saprospiraceae bacterium]